MHKVHPLDAFADRWYCECGRVFTVEGPPWAVCPADQVTMWTLALQRENRLTTEERIAKVVAAHEAKSIVMPERPLPDWYEWAAEEATWK